MLDDLEVSLKDSETVRAFVRDDVRARKLYAALCNQDWETDGKTWAASWRYVGGLVASLRDCGEGYMDFYASGEEGHVDDEVRELLASLGWRPVKSAAVADPDKAVS